MHLVLVNGLGSLPRNSVVRLTDRLDMTIVVDWDVKPQNKNNSFQIVSKLFKAVPFVCTIVVHKKKKHSLAIMSCKYGYGPVNMVMVL